MCGFGAKYRSWYSALKLILPLLAMLVLCAVRQVCAQDFVNFESPHVHPLDITPDGTRLLAVNTADNRLEIFAIDAKGLTSAFSIPVGLEPVSVRVRDNDEAWVVNHLSDSVSVVNLDLGRVVATIFTGDEPADVVFAGSPQRAFVSISQQNRIEVYDPSNLSQAPVFVPIQGEDPRSLVTNGNRVYAAIFEAGNMTTIVPKLLVESSLNPYPDNQSPPPNSGTEFDPPIARNLPDAPITGMIVRKGEQDRWMDDNAHDWSDAVDLDLHGHGLAVIDASSLTVDYRTGLFTTNMACEVRGDGSVAIVGTEALNDIRFEPILNGVFLKVEGALLADGESKPGIRRDLNPHLDYSVSSIPWEQRIQSLGDPRGIAISPADNRMWVTGMGSRNIAVFDDVFNRLGLVEVGDGPTGIVFGSSGDLVFVLNRFEGTVSVVDAIAQSELSRTAFHDPTPQFITLGRPLLYDTHITSGLGHVSCASCHVDGRLDQLAWDLGDPSGQMEPNDLICNLGAPATGSCEDFHPMKGPMVTQTLVGISGTEPLHWRGDRENLEAFDHAFVSLLGGDSDGLPSEMSLLEEFLASISFPPNPNRNLDGTMPTDFAQGDPNIGRDEFFNGLLVSGIDCVTCHPEPSGMLPSSISMTSVRSQAMVVPQLRNMYQKEGMPGSKGFGFTHDGKFDTLFEFLSFESFSFPKTKEGDALRRDVAAFLKCWDTGTHAAIGAQAQIGGLNDSGDTAIMKRSVLQNVAQSGDGQLIARTMVDGRLRGFLLQEDGFFQSDRSKEIVSMIFLDAQASASSPVIYTLVPLGTGVRMALDRDGDGFFDTDEVLACTDPADPQSIPGDVGSCGMDLDGNGVVNAADLGLLLSAWGACMPAENCPADFNLDGDVNAADLGMLLAAWDH